MPEEGVPIGAAAPILSIVPILAVNVDESFLLQFCDVLADLRFTDSGLGREAEPSSPAYRQSRP